MEGFFVFFVLGFGFWVLGFGFFGFWLRTSLEESLVTTGGRKYSSTWFGVWGLGVKM